MSVEFLEIRPRFKKVSPFEIDELLNRLNAVLENHPVQFLLPLLDNHLHSFARLTKASFRRLANKKSPPLYGRLFAVWTGLEPATPCVTGRYSNQLNYQTV